MAWGALAVAVELRQANDGAAEVFLRAVLERF